MIANIEIKVARYLKKSSNYFVGAIERTVGAYPIQIFFRRCLPRYMYTYGGQMGVGYGLLCVTLDLRKWSINKY